MMVKEKEAFPSTWLIRVIRAQWAHLDEPITKGFGEVSGDRDESVRVYRQQPTVLETQ